MSRFDILRFESIEGTLPSMAPHRFLNDTDRYAFRSLCVTALAVLVLLTAVCSFSDGPVSPRPRIPAPPPPDISATFPSSTLLALSADGKRVALSGAQNETMMIGDWRTRLRPASLEKLPCRAGLVTRFSPDGRRLAHVCQDGHIVVWDLITARRIFTSPCMSNGRDARIAWHPDSRDLAAVCARSIRIWDVAAGAEISHFPEWPGAIEIHALAFTASGNLVSGDSEGWLRLWTSSGVPLRAEPFHVAIWGIIARPDEKELAIVLNEPQLSGKFREVVLWNPQTGDRHSLMGPSAELPALLSYSSDGNFITMSTNTGTAAVFSTSGNRFVMSATVPSGEVRDVVFRPDGQTMIAIVNDRVRVWVCCGR